MSGPQTAPAEGDPVSRTLHELRRSKAAGPSPSPSPPPRKKREPKKEAQSTAPSDDSARLRARLDDLTKRLDDGLQGMVAEIDFLKSKMPEEDVAELERLVKDVRKSLGGVKGQLSLQHKQIVENAAELKDIHAGMEDLRVLIDRLHVRSRHNPLEDRVLGDWQVGHVLVGGAAAGAYAAVGTGINVATGKEVVPVGAPQLAVAFSLGAAAWEMTQQTP